MLLQSNRNKAVKIILLALGLAIISFAQEFMGGAVSQLETFFIFSTNFVLAVYLYWLQSRMGLSKLGLWLLFWLNLWIIGNVSNIIEGYFFTDLVTEASLVSGVPFTFVIEFLRSCIAAYLLPLGVGGLNERLSEYISYRSRLSWVGRLIFGSMVYFPIYFSFGGLISPYIIEYYKRADMGLRIPSFPTMIAVEIFRGFLFVLCLFPLLFSTGGGKKRGAAALSGMLFIPGALLPLLNNQELPRAIIPYHLVEILADSIVYGSALSWILGYSNSSIDRDD